MNRSVIVSVVGLALGALLVASAGDAWARADRGGSRGSRSYSAPARPSPATPTNPSSPSRSVTQPAAPAAAQRPSFFRGMMGAVAGFALGGLLGSMLFGGMGGLGGLGGGIGLMEILLIGGGLFLLFTYLRRRKAEAPQPAYATAGGPASAYRGLESGEGGGGTLAPEMPAGGTTDLERGVTHIRSMDPGFDPSAVADTARRMFVGIQQAIALRDLTVLRPHLAPEMLAVLQAQCDRLRTDRQTNRLENIVVRSADVTEAWQETGQDYVTVALNGSLVDYTVDDATGTVVAGSRTEPQEFEEYWTLTRAVGPHPWKLSAIQSS